MGDRRWLVSRLSRGHMLPNRLTRLRPCRQEGAAASCAEYREILRSRLLERTTAGNPGRPVHVGEGVAGGLRALLAAEFVRFQPVSALEIIEDRLLGTLWQCVQHLTDAGLAPGDRFALRHSGRR